MENCELAQRYEGSAEKLSALPPSCAAAAANHPATDMGQGAAASPGDEAWLIGEHRASGEKKYYLANPPRMDLPLAATIKARWMQQAHHMKEELRLDHRGKV